MNQPQSKIIINKYYGSWEKNLKEEKDMTAREFKDLIAEGKCPFCKKALELYFGCIGYESMKCDDCGVICDSNGIHLELPQGEEKKQ